MDRHPAHGDRRSAVIAPGGQGDAQRGGRLLRVLEEQFVEVAHAEEDQGVGLAGLGLEELGHHRSGAGRIGHGRGLSVHDRSGS